jgi:hypothetical protein
MKAEIEKFCKKHNITEDQFLGKEECRGSLYLSSLTSIPEGFNPTVGGELYLSSLTSIPEGFNPTVGGSLDLSSLTSIPEGFNPTVGGELYLSSLTSIPEGFNPTVGGELYLSSLTSIPEGFNPTVGGSLYLSSLTSIPEGFNPTVGGSLYLRSLTSIPEGFNPTVGGSLDLRSLTSIPEGFNPTVGGSLDLSSLTSIPEGFNPTVGGELYLSSLTSIPEGFNPTVGGSLYLRSLTSIPEGFNPTVGGELYLRYDLRSKVKIKKPQTRIVVNVNKFLSWNKGQYIKVDGIFTEVVSKKGNVYRVKKVNSNKEFYLVTDGSRYAHGDTVEQAREDLIYKISESTDKEQYRGLTVDSVLEFEKAIECYRVITGACAFGTKDFIETTGTEKKSYKISDIIKLTEGRYGSDTFKSYFKS